MFVRMLLLILVSVPMYCYASYYCSEHGVTHDGKSSYYCERHNTLHSPYGIYYCEQHQTNHNGYGCCCEQKGVASLTFEEFDKICADNYIDYEIADELPDSDDTYVLVCYVKLERDVDEESNTTV